MKAQKSTERVWIWMTIVIVVAFGTFATVVGYIIPRINHNVYDVKY